ncbi:polysaccharide deacetylase family protein [Cohnella cholangitidis]|uniref:Polysaccharide deacetylase family protein n=1 Tax=Cohnella cholangitidis TaxID=2598458 RepID=A0A7G5C532_9BACL|nr:polysaccharide deacetylase family protein [Cohnella cholangitidis]QMV44316.1 polysaccharide deacetylase family protein [Cohnella cholangitidis]
MKKSKNYALDYRKKNRMKVFKTIVQFALLLLVGFMLFHVLVDVKKFEEPDRSKWTNDKGFIAISYFGVSRTGTPKLIAKKQLDQQLKALKDQGYVAISQQDILDYYDKGKKLPDKALYLSFEDGRNDSSLFAQPLLEKYNFKATFLSYANKMGNSDRKFLQPGDMKKMMKNGYWELGSNGYRLSYINIVGSDGQFIGMKDENELRNKMEIDYYNHFLMDFVRDGNMIPVETRAEMESRITKDYELMNEIYTDKLGFVPNVYMIMHANAMNEGMNRLVSDANSTNIQRIFKMHYNREGNAFNSRSDSKFDLTRIQPQPYWYTNHLLMKLRKDTAQEMKFVVGDENRSKDWTVVHGAAQFIDDRIALTSEPSGKGLLLLKNSEKYDDIQLSANVNGNVVGRQTLYARYDRQKDSYVRVTIENNRLVVEQKLPFKAPEKLYDDKLNDVQWNETELALNKATVYSKEQTSVIDLTEEEQYPVNIKDKRKVTLSLVGNKLNVTVGKQMLLVDRAIDETIQAGSVAIQSEYHEQNEKDDIYDGVFDDIKVSALSKNGELQTTLYSNGFAGVRKLASEMKRAFDSTIDWMIDTF